MDVAQSRIGGHLTNPACRGEADGATIRDSTKRTQSGRFVEASPNHEKIEAMQSIATDF